MVISSRFVMKQSLRLIALLIAFGIWMNKGTDNNNDPTGRKPNVTVALDGSGHYSSISDAVAAAPNYSEYQSRIYIRAGLYGENVVVGMQKTNIIFIGDGVDKTVITSAQHSLDGHSGTATLDVEGDGFVAWSISFENSAGPREGSTVAVRNRAHQSAFYRCNLVGYKNTLHAARGYQFYRECDVFGAVDFIFGEATAVFQTCGLYVQTPLPGQQNVVTAHERETNSATTGFSIHDCIIASRDAFMSPSVETYLGRPGEAYSRVVIIQSYLDVLIHPKGWLASPSGCKQTVHYREYTNSGPGSLTGQRVQWPGFQFINDSLEAAGFTVQAFIDGDQWLPSTGIPFMPGLKLG